MTNANEFEINVPIGHPIDITKMKVPTMVPVAPPELSAAVGRIALAWAEFEERLNRLLSLMLKANKVKLAEHWPFYSLDSRLDHANKQSRICFKSHDDLLVYVSAIITDCKSLQLKRNTILHGEICIKVVLPGPRVSIEATTRRMGKIVTLDLDVEAIDDMFYDICHLGGRTGILMNPSSPIDGITESGLTYLQSLNN